MFVVQSTVFRDCPQDVHHPNQRCPPPPPPPPHHHPTQLLVMVGLNMTHDSRHGIECNAVGIPCEDGSVSWPHAFNSRPFAPVLGGERQCNHSSWVWRRRLRNSHHQAKKHAKHAQTFIWSQASFHIVIHLVREPLVAIRSRWNAGKLGFSMRMLPKHNPQRNFTKYQTLHHRPRQPPACAPTLRSYHLFCGHG